jgi:alkanesulfonate monooxygenase SsuD/methylene tetrahydromethanopterin reductase-like flavin-dependent oxidoreductase (luciferase family)
MKTFRFGVNVGPSFSRADEKARKLEDLGYATLTVPDHLTDFFAPTPTLISAAEATKSLRVGTNVLNNDVSVSWLVEREAATVDLLTEGRLQLGLGARHMQSVYGTSGFGFGRGRHHGRAAGRGYHHYHRGFLEAYVDAFAPVVAQLAGK